MTSEEPSTNTSRPLQVYSRKKRLVFSPMQVTTSESSPNLVVDSTSNPVSPSHISPSNPIAKSLIPYDKLLKLSNPYLKQNSLRVTLIGLFYLKRELELAPSIPYTYSYPFLNCHPHIKPFSPIFIPFIFLTLFMKQEETRIGRMPWRLRW